MTKHAANIDANQLLALSDEVSRISATLARLSKDVEHEAPRVDVNSDDSAPEIPVEAIDWLIQARRLRTRFLETDLFSDPAWDILLDLLRAELVQQRISVSSLCLAANAPPTTALRYINSMTRQGMIIRRPDPFDGRRVYVSLSSETSKALRSYCRKLLEMPFGGR